MSGCVTVTGPPAAICCSNSGKALPLLPSTLPNRTAIKRVPLSLQPLHDQLGHALGHAHDVGWVDRLVGGDQNEIIDPVLPGQQGNVIGAENIIGDGLEAIPLHHGNMLIGCGMEHRLRPIGRKHFPQQSHILDVANHRNVVQLRKLARKFMSQLEKIIL